MILRTYYTYVFLGLPVMKTSAIRNKHLQCGGGTDPSSPYVLYSEY